MRLRQSKTSEWVKVGTSKIAGRGAYAAKDIPKGTEVIEYDGELLDKKEGKARADKQLDQGNFYVFSLNRKQDIDGKKGGDGKYLNHSCKPNCYTINYDDEEIWLITKRAIKKGEELTYSYGLTGDGDEPCRCGAPKCRKFM
jgi:uncharacterized protein